MSGIKKEGMLRDMTPYLSEHPLKKSSTLSSV